MRSTEKIIFVSSAVAFAVLSAAAGARMLYPIDAWALRVTQHRPSGFFDAVGGFFSVVGTVEYNVAAVLVLAAALFLAGRRVFAGGILVAFLATGLLEVTMKMLLPQAPIPEEAARSSDPSPIVEVAFPYPSPIGHILRSVILLGVVYALWPNRLARAAIVLFLAGMVASRVYLGVHWASDVIGGALLRIAGVAWAFKRRKGGH